MADAALCRALDLMDATVDAAKGAARKRGLLRLRAFVADALVDAVNADTSLKAVTSELAPFAVRVAQERGV